MIYYFIKHEIRLKSYLRQLINHLMRVLAHPWRRWSDLLWQQSVSMFVSDKIIINGWLAGWLSLHNDSFSVDNINIMLIVPAAAACLKAEMMEFITILYVWCMCSIHLVWWEKKINSKLHLSNPTKLRHDRGIKYNRIHTICLTCFRLTPCFIYKFIHYVASSRSKLELASWPSYRNRQKSRDVDIIIIIIIKDMWPHVSSFCLCAAVCECEPTDSIRNWSRDEDKWSTLLCASQTYNGRREWSFVFSYQEDKRKLFVLLCVCVSASRVEGTNFQKHNYSFALSKYRSQRL